MSELFFKQSIYISWLCVRVKATIESKTYIEWYKKEKLKLRPNVFFFFSILFSFHSDDFFYPKTKREKKSFVVTLLSFGFCEKFSILLYILSLSYYSTVQAVRFSHLYLFCLVCFKPRLMFYIRFFEI